MSFKPKKVLIVSPAWLGDLIIAQALFKYLKYLHPVQIDIIAPDWSHPILRMMPEISQIVTMPVGHGQLQLKRRWQLGKSLQKEQYQQAIVLPNSWKSALIPWAAGIPLRTGWRGEARYWLLNDCRRLHKAQLPLMVTRFLALACPAKTTSPTPDWQRYRPKLCVSHAQTKQTLNALSLQPPTKPLLILCPGAAYGPAKQWPAEYFGIIAQQKQQAGWEVWLLGSQHDQGIAGMIQTLTQSRCVNFTGKTSIEQAIVLLSLATIVLSNDSGLMHCAAALARPLVAVYGSTSPEFTPPLTNHQHTLSQTLACRPCFQRECPLNHLDCMKKLTPDQVLMAINTLI